MMIRSANTTRGRFMPLLILALIVITSFSAAGQKAYLHLNNAGEAERTFTTNSDNPLTALKDAFVAANAKIVTEDSVSFTAELTGCKWAWEKSDGTPDNAKAIVVINKMYDIGANKIKKPNDVTMVWIVTIAPDKKSYTLKLQDVRSTYGKKTKLKTGYSTGVSEEGVKEVVR